MKTIFKRVGMPLMMGLLLGSQVHASIGVERRSVLVNIAGLDLSTEAGRDLVFKKLRRAAKRACIDVESRHNLSPMLYSQCVNDAVTGAVSQVSDPVFRRYASQRLGIAEPPIPTASRVLR
jgi:UrcA family protein